ncbi:MAG: hypothetical protein WBB25_17160 [Sulfitobacter sp.]
MHVVIAGRFHLSQKEILQVSVLEAFDFQPAIHVNYAEPVISLPDGLPRKIETAKLSVVPWRKAATIVPIASLNLDGRAIKAVICPFASKNPVCPENK